MSRNHALNLILANRALAACLAVMLLSWLPLASSFAQGGHSARTAQVEVSLLAEKSVATAGETLWVGLHFELAPHWHVYWRNPGDSGEPPRIRWELPQGWQAGGIEWPVPARIPVGPLVNYGYENSVLFMVPVTIPAGYASGTGRVDIVANATWLVCKEECIPQDAQLRRQLIVGSGSAAPGPDAPLFQATRARWPVPLDTGASHASRDSGMELRIGGLLPGPGRISDLWFAPFDWGPVSPSQAQSWTNEDGELRLSLPPGEVPLAADASLEGLLVITEQTGDGPLTRGFTLSAPPAPAATTQADSPTTPLTLPLAIVFALAGGLILNLMPCVLPVLSVKALGLVQQTQRGRAHSATHGLVFAAGVVVTFLALAGLLLAVRAGGTTLGWGFQLQEPGVVIALMVLMLALGLNLSGVFTIGHGLAGVGQGLTEARGLRGTFATGVLAVVVASPCTAPFMGSALGFALTRPPAETLVVFTALAIGFALPMTAFSIWPSWARLLPRPGPWMERLRNALAFPLYGTAAWLLWVLSQQVEAAALGAALAGGVLLAFGLWWLGQPLRHAIARRVVATLALAMATVFLTIAGRPDIEPKTVASESATETWSPQRVAELRADDRAILVNFTAAWCITCKVNERVALSTESVQEALALNDITYLKGDWTSRDSVIGAELERFGRSGVPLYLLYPAGPGKPRILPQLLTEGLVLQAIVESTAKPENET